MIIPIILFSFISNLLIKFSFTLFFLANFISLIFAFIIFFLFIYLVFNYQKIFDISYQLIQRYSDKYNYNVKHIEIINYQNLTKYEIVKYFEEYKDKS